MLEPDINLQLILLQFVKAVCSGDFQAYITVMTILPPLMFSLKHQNYARWLPIYIRTMLSKKGCSLSIHGRKVYSAEYQLKIFKNWAGPQTRTTEW